MINAVSRYDFQDAFNEAGRGDQFSYKGLIALFDHLEFVEDNTGEPIELDIVALCCEYAEYENLKEFQNDYGDEYESLEDIEVNTILINIEDTEGFIVEQFWKLSPIV